MNSREHEFERLRDNRAELERLHKVYALRSHMAGFAARNAALRAEAGLDCAPLLGCLQIMRALAAANDFDQFLAADMQFHRTIAEMADTPPLVEMWLVLEETFRNFAGWSHRYVFSDLSMVAETHLAQYEAIAMGDPRAAEHAAQVDLDSLWQIISERPALPEGAVDPVEKVRAYVILNLHRRLSLTAVAREVAYLSPSHLARLFREAHREPFSEYVEGLRMRRAASLLSSTDIPVQRISERVGYVDVSRFSAHFRRHYECTPSDWRKRMPHVAR